MKRRFGPILLIMGVLCGTYAWAQVDTGPADSGAPAQSGPKPAYTYPDATPSLDFLSHAPENSKITLGISTGFTYDSTGYSTGSQGVSWWLYQVSPNIAIQQVLPRLSWNIAYSAGYQTFTHQTGLGNPNNGLFAQTAGGGLLWQF